VEAKILKVQWCSDNVCEGWKVELKKISRGKTKNSSYIPYDHLKFDGPDLGELLVDLSKSVPDGLNEVFDFLRAVRSREALEMPKRKHCGRRG
jgi:hypothetical protein